MTIQGSSQQTSPPWMPSWWAPEAARRSVPGKRLESPFGLSTGEQPPTRGSCSAPTRDICWASSPSFPSITPGLTFPSGTYPGRNRGTLQGFPQFPYQFLLGDPRIALQAKSPYHLVEDRQEGTRGHDAPGRSRGRDPHSHPQRSRTPLPSSAGRHRHRQEGSLLQQSAADGRHPGRQVRPAGPRWRRPDLRMRLRAPWFWFPVDVLLDSLDHTLIFAQQAEGPSWRWGLLSFP